MKSPKISKKSIEQEIDLAEIFGADMTDAPALKEQIAQAIIDRIVERTEKGKGLKFGSSGTATEVRLKAPYSKAYTNTREFKAAGKKANEVNMELTGDMVSSVDLISSSGNKLKIGITNDTQILKAYNHITGDTVPERPWFGISKEELKDIRSQFSSEIKALRTNDLTTPGQQKLIDLLEQINSSDGSDIIDVSE